MSKIIKWTEGDRVEYTPEEYRQASGGRWSAISLMASENHRIQTGELVDSCRANKGVVRRALEEDVFYGELAIPGWFVNNDDGDLSEEFGHQHPGGTVEAIGLLEDYSEKAFRMVARRPSGARFTDHVYNFAWFFVPKSVVTVLTAEAPADEDEMFEFEQAISEARQRENADSLSNAEDLSWQEQLAEVDTSFDPDDYEDVPEESDEAKAVRARLDARSEPVFEVGTTVRVLKGTRKGEQGTVKHVVPNHAWGKGDWTYNVHFSSDPSDWLPYTKKQIANELHVSERDNPFVDEEGDLKDDVVIEYAWWTYSAPVEGYWVMTSPSIEKGHGIKQIEDGLGA